MLGLVGNLNFVQISTSYGAVLRSTKSYLRKNVQILNFEHKLQKFVLSAANYKFQQHQHHDTKTDEKDCSPHTKETHHHLLQRATHNDSFKRVDECAGNSERVDY